MNKRKGCRSCQSYSFSLQRCLKGKINPKTIKGGVEAAQFMGITYICNRDGMNEKVLKAMTK